jgi:hypothetical protein
VTGESTSYKPYTGWPEINEDEPYCGYYPYKGYLYSDEEDGDGGNDYYICEWDTSRALCLPDQVSLNSVKKLDSKTVVLSWKKISDAKGYAIYMKKGKKGTFKKIGDHEHQDHLGKICLQHNMYKYLLRFWLYITFFTII